jgi:hypothetical protein
VRPPNCSSYCVLGPTTLREPARWVVVTCTRPPMSFSSLRRRVRWHYPSAGRIDISHIPTKPPHARDCTPITLRIFFPCSPVSTQSVQRALIMYQRLSIVMYMYRYATGGTDLGDCRHRRRGTTTPCYVICSRFDACWRQCVSPMDRWYW